jgi:hypothetical protein
VPVDEQNSLPRQISVSRDALRADLAEMELRLKSYIGVEMEKKAAAAVVTDMQLQVSELRRRVDEGSFTKAQQLSIDEMLNEKFKKKSKDSWSWKERGILLVGTIVAITSLGFTGVYTIHSLHSVTVDVQPPHTTTSKVHTP